MATTIQQPADTETDDTRKARTSWVASILLDMEMSPSRLDLCPRYEAELMDAMAALCREP